MHSLLTVELVDHGSNGSDETGEKYCHDQPKTSLD